MHSSRACFDMNGNRISMIEAESLLADATRRRVGYDCVNKFTVSTMFLVINHGSLEQTPLLYETLVFNTQTRAEAWLERCTTHEQAVAMHERGIAWAKDKLK